MSRRQPAIFSPTGPDGRKWTIRVGPLGIEALTHEAKEYHHAGRDYTRGIERREWAWRDLLPGRKEA